jgi:alkylhydroperoxidase family enzyme
MKPLYLYPAKVQRMVDALEQSPGATATSLRRAVIDRSAALGGAAREEGDVPEELDGYVKKIALHAYRVTDDDIAALKEAGYSEDAILEITLGAALGAGLARMEAGLAALSPSPDRARGPGRGDR